MRIAGMRLAMNAIANKNRYTVIITTMFIMATINENQPTNKRINYSNQ